MVIGWFLSCHFEKLNFIDTDNLRISHNASKSGLTMWNAHVWWSQLQTIMQLSGVAIEMTKGAESPPMEKIGKNQEKSGENMAKNHKERGKIRRKGKNRISWKTTLEGCIHTYKLQYQNWIRFVWEEILASVDFFTSLCSPHDNSVLFNTFFNGKCTCHCQSLYP